MDMPGYYEFCSRVRIISGHSALERIPATLADLGAGTPLIITDRGVSEAGLLRIVTNALMGHVTIGEVADDVPQDSDVRIVNRLADIYRQKNCDAIIAIGGGSVMDTAKGVNILVSEDAGDLMQFSGAGALTKPLNPLVVVPTTAGTGSEVTLVAVIKNHEKHLKMTFVSYVLLPDAAILDSRMTLTLPPVMTAATAMDALAHAVEAYTGLAKNPLSDSCALAAIRLISHHLSQVMKNPGDKDGRLALANGATMAGMAFSNSMVGIVHTLGHAAGSACGVPHGTAMAILMPYGLEYNMHKNGHHTAELLLPLAGDDVYARTPVHLRPERVIAYIRGMNRELHELSGGGHARCFKEVVSRDGKSLVPHDMLADIAAAALQDGAIFWNPEEADYDDFMMILEAAWEGIPLDRTRIRKG